MGTSRENGMTQNLSDRSPAPSLWGHGTPGRGLSPAGVIQCLRLARGQRPPGLGQPCAGQGVATELMAAEQLSFWETWHWVDTRGGAGELPGSSAEWQLGAWPPPPPSPGGRIAVRSAHCLAPSPRHHQRSRPGALSPRRASTSAQQGPRGGLGVPPPRVVPHTLPRPACLPSPPAPAPD